MVSILLFPLRLVVSLIGWFAYCMEVSADWFVGARGKTEYVREGACNNCGSCCRLVGLELPNAFLRREWIIKIVGLWHRAGLNFHQVGREDKWLMYRCGYYREENDGKCGHCSIYHFRHRLCRFFPRQNLYGYPLLYESCGYRFVKRDVINRQKEIKKKGGKAFRDVILRERERPKNPVN